MKTRTFLAALAALVFVMPACKKRDQNYIGGSVSYVGAVTGTQYIAKGATVELYACETCTTVFYTTKTNSEGRYSFYPVMDGEWWVYAYHEDPNGFTYDNINNQTLIPDAKKESSWEADLVLYN